MLNNINTQMENFYQILDYLSMQLQRKGIETIKFEYEEGDNFIKIKLVKKKIITKIINQ